MDSAHGQLDVKNQDALGWWIRNNCGIDQLVLLCVYMEKQPYSQFNPFKTCTSPTTGGLNIGTTFTVKSREREVLECVTGDEVPLNRQCPSTLPSPAPSPDMNLSDLRTHRLGVEILK